MDSMTAFAMGQASKGKPMMVFDWHKAAKLIKESGAKYAQAGLAGDWEWTGDYILDDGKIPEDNYTFLASTWATPEIAINGDVQDCYIMMDDSPGWDSHTFWPESAKEILGL